MKRMAILYGGKSGEHEVSRVSALSVLRHLDRGRWDPVLIGVSRDGSFWLQPPSVLKEAQGKEVQALPIKEEASARVFAAPGNGLWCRGKRLDLDLVFPVLHGTNGEDGVIQGLLDACGLPFVGAPVMGSALGMDKEKAKVIWKGLGLPVVPWYLVRTQDFGQDAGKASMASAVEALFPYPVFVKPACSGSSVGAGKAADRAELILRVAAALEWDEKAVVEPFIDAREIECSVTGNEAPKAWVPGEIVPHHEFYDYDAKYSDPDGAELVLPARLDAKALAEVRSLAVRAYQALDLAGMARVDFFMERKSGKLMLNEVNTIPGFTSISMFPMMCREGGLPYADLIDHLASLAIERHEARSAIRHA